MISSRDRLLASLVAVQLAAAALFGAVLVHGLDKGSKVTLQEQASGDGGGGDVVGADPSASVDGGAAGTAGTDGTAGTAGTAGQAGTSGGARPSTGAKAPAATVKQGAASTQVLAKGADVKVGSIVSITGVISFKASAQGTKAYIDMVNDAGGVNGHKIVLTQDDDQLDSNRGLQQFKDLANAGNIGYVGLNAPNTEASLASLLNSTKLPVVGAYGEYAEYTSTYAFVFSSYYKHFGWQLGMALADQKVKKPALFYIDNNDANANSAITDGFKNALKSRGITVSDNDVFKKQATDVSYDSEVTTMRVDGVDGMATIVDDTAYKRLLAGLDRASFHPVHVATPLFNTPSVISSSSHTDGTFVLTDIDFPGTSDETKKYEAEVRKRYGNDAVVNYIGEQGWLDAKIFVAALASLGDNISSQGIIDAVENLGGAYETGMTAPLPFGKGVRDINKCLKLGKVVGGTVQQVSNYTCDTQTVK